VASGDSVLMRGQENLSVVTKEGGRRKTYRERERKGKALHVGWGTIWTGLDLRTDMALSLLVT